MSRGRSRRLWRSPYVFAAAALLFATGLVAGGSTFASFTAETENTTATFAGGWVGSASALTVTPSGYNGVLAWSPATHGLDGQTLYGLDNGTSSSCPASGYTSLGALGSATASTFTDSSTSVDNPRSGVNGHYVCYQLVSTRSGTSWTSTASFPATVLGLVPTAIAFTADSPLNNGSTVTITYNQPISLASTSAEVCITSGGSPLITIGTTSCTAAIGSFSGGTAANSNTCNTSSAALVSTTQVQVLLGGCQNGTGHAATMGGTSTFTAAGTDVTSSTGAVPPCTTSLCTPQVTW